MPKKIMTDDKLIQMSKRNKKAKKIFDPSNNYLPKKKNKCSRSKIKKSSSIKQCSIKEKQKASSKSTLENYSSDRSSRKSIPESENSHSTSNLPVAPTEVTHYCYMCDAIGGIDDIIVCPTCFIKVHKECLIITEPMWKFKLDSCSWLCKFCRPLHCVECLESKMDSKFISCVTCKVGLHISCIDFCGTEPLETITNNLFVCKPCLTLATNRLPEEEEEEEEDDEEEEEEEEEDEEKEEEEENERVVDESEEKKYKKKVKKESDEKIDFFNTSLNEINLEDNDNNSINSVESDNSSINYEKEFTEVPSTIIPDVTRWDKYQIYEYLSDRVPNEVLAKLIKHEIDGRALQLLRRADITSRMGLKLGHAMKLYKQVRILQTQSTYHKCYWE